MEHGNTKTLNSLFDAEADALCNAPSCAPSPDQVYTRARHHTRKLYGQHR